MDKKTHKGWGITFWIVAIILGLHYIFIYLPYVTDEGTFSIGSLIIPTIILLVIWLLKRNAEQKLNEKIEKKQSNSNNENQSSIPSQHQTKKQTSNNPFNDFKEQFTEEQKTIIIWFLVKIAGSDGEANIKEEQQLSQTMKLLDYDVKRDTTQEIMLKVVELPVSKLKEVVSTLDKSLKEWFVITAFSLITCDGAIKDEEIESSVYYSSIFGFSVEEHDEIIKKAIALSNHFNN